LGKFARLANDVLQSINLETLELGSSTHYVARRSFIGECETVQVAAAVISLCTVHCAHILPIDSPASLQLQQDRQL